MKWCGIKDRFTYSILKPSLSLSPSTWYHLVEIFLECFWHLICAVPAPWGGCRGGGGEPWFVALADFCGGSTPTLPLQASKARSLDEEVGRDVHRPPGGAGMEAEPRQRRHLHPGRRCLPPSAQRDGPRWCGYRVSHRSVAASLLRAETKTGGKGYNYNLGKLDNGNVSF